MKSTDFKNQSIHESQILTIGAGIIRYGLALVLFWIGILKFTAYESAGIKPLIENSPFLSWGYSFMSVEGFSKLIGLVEIVSGVLIAIKSFSAKISIYGSYMAIITFVITLTFLLTTPGIIQPEYQFPFISPQPGQFLLKDIVLLGAAIWSAGEAKASL